MRRGTMATTTRLGNAARIVAGVGTAAAVRQARRLGNLAAVEAAAAQERRCLGRSAVIDALTQREAMLRAAARRAKGLRS